MFLFAMGCAVDATTASEELVSGAHVIGNAAGWAYLRYEPSGPAFDYVEKGTPIEVSGKWQHGADYVCVHAAGKDWGWMLADGEIGGLDLSKVPSGKGKCELGDIGETSILYWTCHVNADVTLRYEASPAGARIETVHAGQAISVPTAQHCDAPEEHNGMVWISTTPQADGNDCRAPGGGDKGWVLASAVECTEPSQAAIDGVSGCAPSDGCHSKYASAPFTPAAPTVTPLYRYFNAYGVDHMYTVTRNDAGYAYYGYAPEGTEGHVYAAHVDGTVPFYRMFNASNVDTFYTTSSGETQTAEALGYSIVGIEAWIFDHEANGTVPLYRYWNAVGADHFYTLTRNDTGYASFGYTLEGIAGYVFP